MFNRADFHPAEPIELILYKSISPKSSRSSQKALGNESFDKILQKKDQNQIYCIKMKVFILSFLCLELREVPPWTRHSYTV